MQDCFLELSTPNSSGCLSREDLIDLSHAVFTQVFGWLFFGILFFFLLRQVVELVAIKFFKVCPDCGRKVKPCCDYYAG